MMLRRVLVTGGAGLIGSHIVDELLQLPVEQVVVYDNFVRGRLENLARVLTDPRVSIVEGDIRDRDHLSMVMRGPEDGPIDTVFHQAAIRITQCASEPRLALEVLVEGTYNVLEAAVASGVKKVVAASSASVYGAADAFPTSEQHHPYNNRTIYGAAKAFNELTLRSFNEMYGLDYVALRYFNVYGPRMDVHGAYTEVLIRWMERIEAGQPPVIFGDGTDTMDFIYVGDVARANILAAQALADRGSAAQGSVSDQVFNVASGVETSLRELAHALLRVMASDLQLEYGPPRKVNAVPRRLANTRKAKRLLGFEAQVDLEEGLRRLVAWWRQEKRVAQVKAVTSETHSVHEEARRDGKVGKENGVGSPIVQYSGR